MLDCLNLFIGFFQNCQIYVSKTLDFCLVDHRIFDIRNGNMELNSGMLYHTYHFHFVYPFRLHDILF
ncbi:hypothetical protein CW304_16735 [Bacillus sp. UFRGS-B20]|nr:hypothetical protein CW304_16735 [Bacillus sp. UFRGS-B20]